jgi:hypothetical protein
LHYLEHVESPTSFFDFEFFEGAEATVGAANFGCGACGAVGDDGNAGVLGDFIEQDVAADPPSPASGRGKRRAAFDCGKCEGKVRDQNDRANCPRG